MGGMLKQTGFSAKRWLVLVLSLLLATMGRSARADDVSPKAEIMVIHATNCDKPNVDPRIGEAPPLKYACYNLIEKQSVALTKGQASVSNLPDGRIFQLTYNNVAANRYKISAAISQVGKAGFQKLADITAEPNKPFTVGGFAYRGGALVLTIRIKP